MYIRLRAAHSRPQEALQRRGEHLVDERQRLGVVPEDVVPPPERPRLSKLPAAQSRPGLTVGTYP